MHLDSHGNEYNDWIRQRTGTDLEFFLINIVLLRVAAAEKQGGRTHSVAAQLLSTALLHEPSEGGESRARSDHDNRARRVARQLEGGVSYKEGHYIPGPADTRSGVNWMAKGPCCRSQYCSWRCRTGRTHTRPQLLSVCAADTHQAQHGRCSTCRPTTPHKRIHHAILVILVPHAPAPQAPSMHQANNIKPAQQPHACKEQLHLDFL